MYRVRGAILIGIFLVSIASWPRSTPITLFPHTDKGEAAFDFFKKVVAFTPLNRVGVAIDVSEYLVPGGPHLIVLVVRQLWKWQGVVCTSHYALCRYSR